MEVDAKSIKRPGWERPARNAGKEGNTRIPISARVVVKGGSREARAAGPKVTQIELKSRKLNQDISCPRKGPQPLQHLPAAPRCKQAAGGEKVLSFESPSHQLKNHLGQASAF